VKPPLVFSRQSEIGNVGNVFMKKPSIVGGAVVML